MGDMSAIIVPKSDQINADDLLGRTITITVTDVSIRGGQEQPISIHFEGSEKVFRPCKSMCRVLANGWGLDSKAYIGRSMMLYCDPTVKFGPLAVGGIRISHMTHIDGPMVMALTATKGVKKSYKVLPLVAEQSAKEDPAVKWASGFIGMVDRAEDGDALRKLLSDRAVKLDELAEKRPDLRGQVQSAVDYQAELLGVDLSAQEGPTDEQRGETHNGALATALDHLPKKVRVMDVDSLIKATAPQLSEDELATLQKAADERIADILADDGQ